VVGVGFDGAGVVGTGAGPVVGTGTGTGTTTTGTGAATLLEPVDCVELEDVGSSSRIVEQPTDSTTSASGAYFIGRLSKKLEPSYAKPQ
jgi:hypothetical protein